MHESPGYSKTSPLQRFAQVLVEGLRQELELTPKPGLVDLRNSGSHNDLNYRIMSQSICLLGCYFNACAEALESGCGIGTLRKLGIEAERAMWNRFATNTHRGAVFLGGLMLTGVRACGDIDSKSASAAVAGEARRLFHRRLPANTTGAGVRKRFGAGGIISEALRGLPSVFEVGVPALTHGFALGMSTRKARFLAMARLMQQVEDTTSLRRCGSLGLTRIRRDGSHLEQLLLAGKNPDPFLINTDRNYRARRLTMGGVADLLAMSIAWYYRGITTDIPHHEAQEINFLNS